MRTKDEFRVDRALASRAKRQIVEILQQVLLLQRPLKRLVQRLFWAQDEIQQQPRDKEQYDEERRENLSEDASAPRLDIAKRPSNQRKPERDEVRDSDREQELGASCGGFDHEPFPLVEPCTVTIAAKLRVPDSLELPDRKHKHTCAAGALFGRTRDPEFGLPGQRPQWLDSSRTPAGPGLDKGQDITHLIVIDPDHQRGQPCAADCRVTLDLRRGRADRCQIR
jgi:hypothetical protein